MSRAHKKCHALIRTGSTFPTPNNCLYRQFFGVGNGKKKGGKKKGKEKNCLGAKRQGPSREDAPDEKKEGDETARNCQS